MIITGENMHQFKRDDIVEYDSNPTVKGTGRITNHPNKDKVNALH